MSLDSSLIGVVGACSALFAIFCVLAVIIGCYCLRRARERHLQQLLDGAKERKKEQEVQAYHNPHYIHDSSNSVPPPALPPRHSHGDSVPQDDIVPPKITQYRPKIVEDSMISKGYREDSRSSVRESRGVPTIYENIDDIRHPTDPEPASLGYTHTNGFIAQGYLRSSTGGRSANGGSLGGSRRGQIVYGYPAGYHGAVGAPVYQELDQLGQYDVIRERGEIAQNGRWEGAMYERQNGDPRFERHYVDPRYERYPVYTMSERQSVDPRYERHYVYARSERKGIEPSTERQHVDPRSEKQNVNPKPERQYEDQTSNLFEKNKPVDPSAASDEITNHTHNGEGSSPKKDAGLARAVSFGHLNGVEERPHKEYVPVRSHRQRDWQEEGEMQSAFSPPVPKEPNQEGKARQREDAKGDMAPAVSNTGVSQEVLNGGNVDTASEREPIPTSSNSDALDQTSGDVAEHHSGGMSTRPDNYKVIRREHSGHSPMPEWTGQAQTVDNPKRQAAPRRVYAGDERLAVHSLERPNHRQRSQSGQTSPLLDSHIDITTQPSHPHADTNNTSSAVTSKDHARHSTPIAPASNTKIPPKVPPRPKTKYAGRRRPVSFLQEIEDVFSKRKGHPQADYDDVDDVDGDGEDETSVTGNHLRQPSVGTVSSRPAGYHERQPANTQPSVSRNIRDFIDDLTESIIF